jgi:ABC-type multidrug transport system ATPase subunit/pSer/pThr/pTyr-binding forkhead associated (FHA) protein
MPLILRLETDDVIVVKKTSRALIGRESALEVTLRHPKVSRTHAEVLWEGEGWILRDLESANGTLVDGARIAEAPLTDSHLVQFGGRSGPKIWITVTADSQTRTLPVEALVDTNSLGAAPEDTRSDSHIPLPPRLLIGRNIENDIVLRNPEVSEYEASIIQGIDGRHEIVVTGRSKKTSVNAETVSKRRRLAPGDELSIGPWSMRYTGSALEPLDASGGVSFSAKNLSVWAGDKLILDSISFELRPRTVTAIVGPSGAGKSTLLNALTGRRPASEGNVVVGGINLYEQYDQLRQRIGLVPQADLLHTSLRTEVALEFAAALRFPHDSTPQERAERIEEVLGVLGLEEHRWTRIDQLSGGQRKRASVALELLTEPELLFLDEPTSGLDPGLDRQVMNQLRELANAGRTIVVVTHSVANLDVCDEVIVLAPGGRLAYQGSPHGVLKHFSSRDWAEVFDSLTAGNFPAAFSNAIGSDQEVSRELESSVPFKRQGWFHTFWHLCARYLAVIGSDRYFLALLVLLPFILALVGSAVGADYGLGEGPDGFNFQARSLLLVLVLGSSFIGLSSSIQELVRERTIYERERSIGLSAGAYLISKLAVLGAIVALQTSLFILLTTAGRDMPAEGLLFEAPLAEIVLAGVGLALASMCFGLLLSALVNSPEVTMPTLVLTTMAQVVLSGAVPIRFHAALDLAGFVNPGYWAMSWMGATVDLNSLAGLSDEDEGRFWDALSTNAEISLLGLIVLTAVFVAATRIALDIRER